MGRACSSNSITPYSRTALTGNIYGLVSTMNQNTLTGIIDVNDLNTVTPCTCISSVDPVDALKALRDFLNKLYVAILEFNTSKNVNAPLVAFMNITGAMKFSLHVRIVWSKLHPGAQFNPDDIIHINGLKDIYLSANRDWHSDTFIVTKSRLLELNRA